MFQDHTIIQQVIIETFWRRKTTASSLAQSTECQYRGSVPPECTFPASTKGIQKSSAQTPIGASAVSSKSNLFSVQSSVPMGASLYTWTPITGSGNNCQNVCPSLGAENPRCGRRMPPSFTRAPLRLEGQNKCAASQPCGHSFR